MSAIWVVPILVGVVAICVVGVFDSFLHMANRRLRAEADALAALAEEAEALGAARVLSEGLSQGRAGSGTRAPRN